MAGIYIHVPFCRKACTYCDFHFSTNLKNLSEFTDALLLELVVRKDYLGNEKVNTIYFGGGTPSLLSSDDINRIFDKLNLLFKIDATAEITLEANPDDLTDVYIRSLRNTAVNRLSIGIQSFNDHHLEMMNRAHRSNQAIESVQEAASAGFENISIDLIYGIPGAGMESWQSNIQQALSLPVQHISCYCLTVETGTVLYNRIQKGMQADVNDEEASAQFLWWINTAEQAGFPWYEISNFSKKGFESKHNSNYWNNVPYLGLGPSAHSYDGMSRSWNIRNNAMYIRSSGVAVEGEEMLNEKQRYHDTVMTGLRTRKGLNTVFIRDQFGDQLYDHVRKMSQPWLEKKFLKNENEILMLSTEGLLFADRITSDLFLP